MKLKSVYRESFPDVKINASIVLIELSAEYADNKCSLIIKIKLKVDFVKTSSIIKKLFICFLVTLTDTRKIRDVLIHAKQIRLDRVYLKKFNNPTITQACVSVCYYCK